MITFNGTVKKIIYQSKNRDEFRILKLENSSGEVKVKGHLPCVYEGFYLEGMGEVEVTEDYGETIIIKQVEIKEPGDRESIANYFLFLLGQKNSFDIENSDFEEIESSEDELLAFSFLLFDISSLHDFIEWFGRSFLDQIEDNLDYVKSQAEKRGLFDNPIFDLGKARTNLLVERELRNIAAELRKSDPIYAKFAKGLYTVLNNTREIADEYNSVLDCLKQNPYLFCFRRNLQGFSFEVADTIASMYNLPKDSENRCFAGVKHAFITKIMSEGHVWAEEEKVIHESLEVLKIDEAVLLQHIENMYQSGRLVKEDALRVYLNEYYEMEADIARKLVVLNAQQCEPDLIDPDFATIEETLQIELTEEQKDAIRTSINSSITLITGGPGTGKSTIIRGIVSAFEEAGEKSIVLAAQTGKAANRLRETTQREATTIHRLLGIKPNSSRNEVNKIANSVIIIDEASMIDIELMDKLMFSIEPPAHLILVGDVDQLPSIGPGYVFHDIIESDSFNTVRLTQVFRQEEQSSIKLLAKSIINGEMMPAPTGDSDYHFIEAESKEDIEKKIIETIKTLLNIYPAGEIQVLTPIREHICGAKRLNDILQPVFNSTTGRSYTNKEETFFSGDRVMQIHNDYRFEVFNGEMTDETNVCWDYENGCTYLRAVYPPDETIIEYYPKKYNADWITRAYAITVHKSQGSEYPIIIMPIFSNKNLYRNLLYTAATRAKKLLYFIGFEKDFEEGIQNISHTERNTYLAQRIRMASFH